MLEELKARNTPCYIGKVNGHDVKVVRDTGSTSCVVKTSLVKPDQMTGDYELCMLIDGVVKRFPTAIVHLDTPYFTGEVKALCIDHPVEEVIVGNVQGVTNLVIKNGDNKIIDNHTPSCDITGDNYHHYHTDELLDKTEVNSDTTECPQNDRPSTSVLGCSIFCTFTCRGTDNQIAAVQTRAMVANEQNPVRPLNVTYIKGIDIGPDQLTEQQKADKA